MQTLFCTIATAEAAVILAEHFPSPLSARVLSYLLPFPPAGGRPPAFRLSPLAAAGLLLGIGGGLLRVWCHRTLGRFFTWQVAVRDGHRLVTDGPYALARHPSYTGWAMLTAGNALLLASAGSYFVEAGWSRVPAAQAAAAAAFTHMSLIAVNMFFRVSTEDRVMRQEFGEAWDRWAKATPYRLIPYVY